MAKRFQKEEPAELKRLEEEEALVAELAKEAVQEVMEERAMEEAPPMPEPPAPFVTAGFVVVRALKTVEWARMGAHTYDLKQGKELEMLEGHAQELAQVGVVEIVK